MMMVGRMGSRTAYTRPVIFGVNAKVSDLKKYKVMQE